MAGAWNFTRNAFFLFPEFDNGGGGGGITGLQNGLNLFSPTIGEWGGSLLRDTQIVGGGFGVDFENVPFTISGTAGATPITGAGTRLMYVPDLGSLAAGTVLNTEWDSLGTNSFTTGNGVRNIGGNNALGFGDNNVVSQPNSIVGGTGSVVAGANSFAMNGTVTFQNSMAFYDSQVGAPTTFSWGFNTVTAPGNFTFAFGGVVPSTITNSSEGWIFGDNMTIDGINHCLLAGSNFDIDSINYGFIFGRNATVNANSTDLFVFTSQASTEFPINSSGLFVVTDENNANTASFWGNMNSNNWVMGPTDTLAGLTTFTSHAVLVEASAAAAQMRWLDGGVDPVAPADGEMWRNGNRINFRVGGVTEQLAYLSDTGGGGSGQEILLASQIGDASGTVGLYAKSGEVNGAQILALTNPFDTWQNNALDPFFTTDEITIDEINMQIAACAVSTATADASPLINLDIYTVQSTGRTLIQRVTLPVDGLNCGVFNNTAGNNFQIATATPAVVIPANSLWGIEFANVTGSGNINALRQVVAEMKISR